MMPSVNPQSEIGVLTLNGDEHGISVAAIDASGSYGYFGTSLPAGAYYSNEFDSLVKVNLANFSRAGTLRLAPNETYSQTLFVDSTGGFAYLGVRNFSDWQAFKIIKIRLLDLSRVAALQLHGFLVYSAVMDTKGFAYFGVSPGGILKIRLSDLTVVATLTLGLGAFGLQIDNTHGFLYAEISSNFGNNQVGEYLVKVDLSAFTEVNRVMLDPTFLHDDGSPRLAAIDTSAGYAYLVSVWSDRASMSSFSSVVRVRLLDLTFAGAVSVGPGDVVTAVLDSVGGFAYFGWGQTVSPDNSTISIIRLSDFTLSGNITVNKGFMGTAVIDPIHGFAYFAGGRYDQPGYIIKLKLIPPALNQPTTSIQSSQMTNTTSSSPPQIPGFPLEAIVVGVTVTMISLGLSRMRKHTNTAWLSRLALMLR
jgi:hypothetical protein